MTLDELISPIQGRLGVLERRGDQHVVIGALTDDSRQVQPGALFVAVQESGSTATSTWIEW